MGHDDQPLGQRNYQQFAQRYADGVETKAHNAYYELPSTLSLLPDVKGLKVLDAGCGPGHKSAWLLDQGAQVVAVDVTPEFVDIARKRLGDRADVLQADLTQPLSFQKQIPLTWYCVRWCWTTSKTGDQRCANSVASYSRAECWYFPADIR